MNFKFTDENSDQDYPYLGSYGIGSTRVMGAWVEVSNDQNGIIWSDSIAPFNVHLIELPGGDNAADVKKILEEKNIDVLWDDREVTAGQKFSDADLIGIPWRVVVSAKTEGNLEVKRRNETESSMMAIDDFVKLLTQ